MRKLKNYLLAAKTKWQTSILALSVGLSSSPVLAAVNVGRFEGVVDNMVEIMKVVFSGAVALVTIFVGIAMFKEVVVAAKDGRWDLTRIFVLIACIIIVAFVASGGISDLVGEAAS